MLYTLFLCSTIEFSDVRNLDYAFNPDSKKFNIQLGYFIDLSFVGYLIDKVQYLLIYCIGYQGMDAMKYPQSKCFSPIKLHFYCMPCKILSFFLTVEFIFHKIHRYIFYRPKSKNTPWSLGQLQKHFLKFQLFLITLRGFHIP